MPLFYAAPIVVSHTARRQKNSAFALWLRRLGVFSMDFSHRYLSGLKRSLFMADSANLDTGLSLGGSRLLYRIGRHYFGWCRKLGDVRRKRAVRYSGADIFKLFALQFYLSQVAKTYICIHICLRLSHWRDDDRH